MRLPIRPPGELYFSILPQILFEIENFVFYPFRFEHGLFAAEVIADAAVVEHIRFPDNVTVEIPFHKQVIKRHPACIVVRVENLAARKQLACFGIIYPESLAPLNLVVVGVLPVKFLDGANSDNPDLDRKSVV